MMTINRFRFPAWAAMLGAILFTGTAIAQDAAAPAPAKLDPPVKAEVSGKYLANDKPAAIKYVIVTEQEDFSGKPAIGLIFTEKDPSKSKKPKFDAMFNKLGNALEIATFHDGDIFSCQVMHSAHSKSGFSSSGKIKIEDFKMAGGNVSGKVTTGGPADAFGESWEVELTFSAPLTEKQRADILNPPKPVEKKEEAAEAEEPEPTGPKIAVKDLPLPKDGKNVQYKTVVEQIELTTPRSVTAMTKEISGALKEKGWKEGAGGLKMPKNAILKYEQGVSKVTVMIKPSGAGSVVQIFTDDMDWDGVEATPAAPAKTTNAADEVDNAQKEAQKAINDALKGIPGF